MNSDYGSSLRISVVIAAYRASQSIGIAVRSALAQPMVEQVIVVDDCSPDNTAQSAWEADDGTGRLIVVRQTANAGPAMCRNRGFDLASAPYIAILDADDFFLPERFAALFATLGSDWDLAADNIAFVRGEADKLLVPSQASLGPARRLDAIEFIEANISRRGRRRAELGFLKPVFRKAFVAKSGLRYDESLRLGEDFVLYVDAFLAGARFRLTSGCGYVAVEHAKSLSGQHRTGDLKALAASVQSLRDKAGRRSAITGALRRHYRHVRRRYIYRAFLDARRQAGVIRALGSQLLRPADLPVIFWCYLRDRTALAARGHQVLHKAGAPGTLRYLMEA